MFRSGKTKTVVTGFASMANRAYLTRGGGHYIHAEKLRHTNPRPPPRWAAPTATTASRTTYGSKRSTSPRGTARRARGPSGSSCATTRRPPNATGRSARTWSPTCSSRSTDPRLACATPRRAGRLPARQARAAPLHAPHEGRGQGSCASTTLRSSRSSPGRQVAAVHLRPHPHRRQARRPSPTRLDSVIGAFLLTLTAAVAPAGRRRALQRPDLLRPHARLRFAPSRLICESAPIRGRIS